MLNGEPVNDERSMRVLCQQRDSCRDIGGALEMKRGWDGDQKWLDLLCKEELVSIMTSNRGYMPSTAAMTTLSSAVSVALVKLQRPFKSLR